jgi:hypothetical protein
MCYSKKKFGNGRREGDCHDQCDGPIAPGRTNWASKERSAQEAQTPVPGIGLGPGEKMARPLPSIVFHSIPTHSRSPDPSSPICQSSPNMNNGRCAPGVGALLRRRFPSGCGEEEASGPPETASPDWARRTSTRRTHTRVIGRRAARKGECEPLLLLFNDCLDEI